MEKTITYNQPSWVDDLLKRIDDVTPINKIEPTEVNPVNNTKDFTDETKVKSLDVKTIELSVDEPEYSVAYWKQYFLNFKNPNL